MYVTRCGDVCEWRLCNMWPCLLKQRYSTEASVQHSHLCDPPPGRLPEQVGGHRQQQFCAHQRGRPCVWTAEEKHPDVNIPEAIREMVNRVSPVLLTLHVRDRWVIIGLSVGRAGSVVDITIPT